MAVKLILTTSLDTTINNTSPTARGTTIITVVTITESSPFGRPNYLAFSPPDGDFKNLH